ncbi:MAG: RNA 2',3'-cyclic phosphodiesterase [Candidatus Omnitrophota bacterium]
MRTFIAIALTEEAHEELSSLQDSLRKSGADIKWVKPDHIHLTLKFLGEIDEEQAAEIKASIDETVKNQKPFDIHLAKIGAFPRIAFPKIVWVGIDEGSQGCMALAKSVEEAMQRLGFEKEKRPFSPHLTLGRVRSLKNNSQLTSAVEKEKDFSSQTKVSINKITLFQSTLTPKGPIYTPLKEFSLE